MKRCLRKQLILTGLLLLVGGNVIAQDASPLPPSDKQARTPQEMETLKQKYAERKRAFLNSEQQRVEAMLPRLNPAYRPLFPLYYETQLGVLAEQSESSILVLFDLFDAPLAEVEAFVHQTPIQTTLNITQNWLQNFHGSDLGFVPPTDGDGTSEHTLLESVSHWLLASWGGSERICFATGQNDRALDHLEDSLRFYEIMGKETLSEKKDADLFLDNTPAVFAHHIASFTPAQCARLIRILKHWKASLQVAETLVIREMKEEQKTSVQEVLNDGTLWDQLCECRRDSETGKSNLTEKPVKDDLRLTSASALPPTSEAVKKRKQVADAIEENYHRMYRLIKNPFAILPPLPVRPKWLEELANSNYDYFIEFDVPCSKLLQLRLALLEAHVAVRQFQWEHDRLPVSLAELQNPKRMTDPASGKFFNYSTDGETYTLTSSGVPESQHNDEETPLRAQAYDLLAEELQNPRIYFDTCGTGMIFENLPEQKDEDSRVR